MAGADVFRGDAAGRVQSYHGLRAVGDGIGEGRSGEGISGRPAEGGIWCGWVGVAAGFCHLVACVVRAFAVQAEVEAGVLFELRFNKIIPKRSFCVVLNEKLPQSAAAGKLLQIMEL